LNYDPESLAIATRELLDVKRGIKNPAIIVDASHDNSRNGNGKDPTLQAYVVRNVLEGMRRGREEYALVRGFMIEAHILGGRQKGTPDPEIPQSITDPCIPWEEYERIVLDTADALR
jgi:3-deoxy-7-phosphoheptulonate synthase